MIFRFDDFELDTDNFLLRGNGLSVKTEPLVFDLISHLVQNANTVQSKDQLLAVVWSGKVVSDTTIASAIKSARKALGDNGTDQKYIKTHHGRGFSFILDEAAQDIPLRKSRNDERFKKPSLIVCVEPSPGSEEHLDLAQSFTHELERIFSRVPLLSINREVRQIGTGAERLSPKQIYEELGVEYLLNAQISDKGDSNIAAQLIDAKTSTLLFSQTFAYKQSLGECLMKSALLDTIRQFEPQILKHIYQSVTGSGNKASAESKFIEASGVLALKGWHEASFLEATNLLRECSSLNSNFAQAPAYLSLLLAFGHRVGILTNRQAAKNEALEMIDKALDLESHDSTVLGFCGCALADVGLVDRGLSLLNKALNINPLNSHAMVARGAAKLSKQELKQGIEDMEQGIALSPLDSRLAVWHAVLANAYLLAGDIDRAYEKAIEGCNDSHKTYMPRIILAAIEFKKGNLEKARLAIEEANSIDPGLSKNQVVGFLGEKLGSRIYALL